MSVTLRPGAGGLGRLVLSHPAGSRAEVYLHGAHVTSWTPARGAEWLFLSRSARFEEGGTIRGGIPVVFPQFADRGTLPKHGFVRRLPWRWANPEEAADVTRAVLQLRDSDESLAQWPHRFAARLSVDLGADQLEVTLEVENTDDAPFSFTAALHSYFRVEDVRRAAVTGLEGARYLDKPADMAERTQAEPLVGVGGEVDRVYFGAPPAVTLLDHAAGRALRVTASGFADTVVWNPWSELASELPDMAADEYLRMLCVEAAQVLQPVVLEPGGTWRGSQRLRETDRARSMNVATPAATQ
jgi:glucose-6-phosphate 1-epimerase